MGREFNLGSPKQLQVILFDELGLPKTKRIKTGYTTDAEALQSLYAQTEHPLLEHLLRHRDMSKLLVTVEGLQKLGRRRRAHPHDLQPDRRRPPVGCPPPTPTCRTSRSAPTRVGASGRRSSSATGFETLLTADYSQVEMRIMAHLSGDEALIEAFASGEDLHTTVASRVFDVAPRRGHRRLRARIKAMSYGLAYGLSPYGLGQQLGIPPEEARVLMDEYFERFGGVRDYLNSGRRRGASDRLHRDRCMGRRRYLPDLTSDNRQRREMAERMALNAPIQGSAADIIKVAMLERRTRAGLAEGLSVADAAPGARRAGRSRWRPGSARPSRSWCGARWAAPTRCGRRWTCRWATGRTWDDAAH